ncbi:hypothetical protein VTO73DRAFT_6390 [Trametes versicolor]
MNKRLRSITSEYIAEVIMGMRNVHNAAIPIRNMQREAIQSLTIPRLHDIRNLSSSSRSSLAHCDSYAFHPSP